MPVVMPYAHRWAAAYGRTYLLWIGPTPAIFSTDLELIKQVLTDKAGQFPKYFMIPALRNIFGDGGLVVVNGDDWKRHRKVVNPAFSRGKIKSMSLVAVQVAEEMTQRWRDQIHHSGDCQAAEIDVNDAFRDLTTEIIGRVAFATDRREGDEIILLWHKMAKLGVAAMTDAPILWYLPTRRNLRARRLDKLLRSRIVALMQARVAAKDANRGYGDDLLALLLEAWSPERPGSGEALTTQEVVDECKTFFATGQETTGTLLVWTMFLLSVHPQWQEKVREEVLGEFGSGDGGEAAPSTDALAKLKLLNMVLLETLRLYPPVVYIQRRAASDVKLGGLDVPRGTVISIPIGMLHRDKEVWGPDADEFNPMRFENGVSTAAKDPKALLSFSLGPRTCIGQTFSMVEAQIAMVMILRKFSFSLSPKYAHKPKFLTGLSPKLGMPLIVRNLEG
ncbi:hypothetical protein ACP70R_048905 [Stipagrostis hirtigluma subsp. patula]